MSASSYIKNVGKSFGYTLGKSLESYNPVLKSLLQETKENAETIYDTVKSFSFDKPSFDEKSLKGNVKDSIKDIWDNTKSDLKSGKWYNKERADALDAQLTSAGGAMVGMDFDLDEDWGDFDFDFDDFDDDTQVEIASDTKNTVAIINSIDQVGSAVSSSINNTTVESASYIADTTRQGNKALYSLNQRGFSNVTSALMTVNNSIVSFAKIGEPLTAHINNAATFYTKTSQQLEEIKQALGEISKNTVPATLSGSKNSSYSGGNTLNDIFGDAGITISAYKSMLEENFKNSGYDDIIKNAVAGAKKFVSGGKGGGSMGKNISLTQMVMTSVTNVMIPIALQEAMKGFNEALKYSMGAGVVKARNSSFGTSMVGIILDMFKDDFLPQDRFRTNINNANYEKGAVAWDGIARKSLVEVIPTYLAKIYARLGGEEKYFDYEDGRFVSLENIGKRKNEDIRRAARDAGGDFREDVLKAIKEMEISNKEQMEKEVESYFRTAFLKGEGFYDINNSNKFTDNDMKKFGLTKDSLKIIAQVLKEYEKNNQGYKANKYIVENALRRDEYGENIRRLEASGTSPYLYLSNGFTDAGSSSTNRPGSSRLFGIDEYGHDNFYYLRGIYRFSRHISDNIRFIADPQNSKFIKVRPIKKGSTDETDTNSSNFSSFRSTVSSARRSSSISSPTSSTYNSSTYDELLGRELDEDEIRQRQQEENAEKVDKKAKEYKNKAQKIISEFLGLPGGIRDKVANAAAGILNTINTGLYKAFWGSADKDDGLFGYIFTKTKEAMNKFNDFIEESFGVNVKEKIKKFIDDMLGEKDENGKRKGGKLGEFRDATVNNLKRAGSSIGRTVQKIFYGKDFDNDIGEYDNGQAANGRKVTKTGIVAVSEGELIVPAELNPYYHGVVNKGLQVAKERQAIDNFYGAFSNGGTVGDIGIEKRWSRQENKFVYINTKTGKKWKNQSAAEKIYNKIHNKEQSAKKKEAIKAGKGIFGNIYKGADKMIFGKEDEETGEQSGGLVGFFKNLFGDKDQEKKDNSIIKDNVLKATREMSSNKGAMGAGALIGAGVSIATGAVVGPLFGAALGAGVGLVASSKKAQEWLFGKTVIDEKGNETKEGGKIPAQISTFITKHVPSMGKGAAIGSAAGAFLGSPILGAIVGSAVGFVNTSDIAKEKIFGKYDENGNEEKRGLIPKSVQDAIKKAAPNIAIGGTLGAVAGLVTPLGLAPALIVGSGIGFMTSSSKFHTWLFGDKENNKQGFVDILKDKVLGNVDRLFRNQWNALKGFSKNLVRSIGHKIIKALIGKVKAKSADKDSLLGKLFSGIGGAVNKVTSGVGNIIGGAADRRQRKNLLKGYDVYGTKADGSKGTLNAIERTNLRQEFDNKGKRILDTNGFSTLDAYMATANKNQLNDLYETMQKASDPDIAYKQNMNEVISDFLKDADNLNANAETVGDHLDEKQLNRIAKLIRKGDYEKLNKEINSYNLDDYTKKELNKIVSKSSETAKSVKENKQSTEDMLKKLSEEYGINLNNTSLAQAMDLVKSEMGDERFKEEKLSPEKQDEKNDRKTIVDTIQEINENLKNIKLGEPSGRSNSIVEINGKYYKLFEFTNPVNDEVVQGKRRVRKKKGKRNKRAQEVIDRATAYQNQNNKDSETEYDEEVADNGVGETEDIPQAAYGRAFTRKGLAAVSAGELIIAAKNNPFYGSFANGGIIGSAKKMAKKVKSTFDMFGNIHQYVENKQGEQVEDSSDSETRKSRGIVNKFTNAVNGIPGMSTGLSKITGLFTSMKDRLFGSEDGTKKGIFASILSFLSGEDGPLGWISSLLSGTPLGSLTSKLFTSPKTLLANVASSLLTNVVGPWLLYEAFDGKLNSFFSTLTNGAYNSEDKSETEIYEDGNTGKTITKDDSGNWVDSDGNIVEDPDINARQGGTSSFADNLKYNTVRNTVTGKASVASKILGATSLGKTVSSAASKASSYIADFSKAAVGQEADALYYGLQSNIADSLASALGKLKKLPVFKNIDTDSLAGTLAEKISNALSSQAAEKIANIASTAVVVARVAFAVADFTTGYEDARTTLGIIQEPTTGQKIVSGLLRVVKNLIPIVGTLIPDSTVIDVFCDYVAPALGIDASELMAEREEAQATVDAYNEANGTDYSVGDFNKAVLQDYTWTERIGNAAKSTWEDTKQGVSNAVNGIKEQGLFGYIGSSVKGMASDFMNSYQESGGGLSGIFSAIGDTFGNMLPGVLGDISKAKGDIRAYAIQGDLKSLWGVTLPDFSGGEEIEGTDLTTAVPGIFSKIIGQIPLIVTKVGMTPIALVSWLGHKVVDGLSGIVEKITPAFEDIQTNIATLNGYMKSGDISGLWGNEVQIDEENPLGGFMKVINFGQKISFTIPTAISWVGHKIVDTVTGTIDKVKAGFEYIKSQQDYGTQLLKDPNADITDYFKIDEPDEENPMGGFMKTITVVARLSALPKALVQWVGNIVKDGVETIKEKVVTAARDVYGNQQTLVGYMKSGDVSALWSNEVQIDEDNPLGGFMKVINVAQKIGYTVPTAFMWVGNKIKSGVETVKEKVSTAFSDIMNNYDTLKGLANSGDVAGIWSNDVEIDEENPLGGFMKVINFGQKLSWTLPGVFHYVGNKIKETVTNLVDGIKTDYETTTTSIDALKSLANDGDVSGVANYQFELTAENDPLSGIFTVGFKINQVFQTVVAFVRKMVGPIIDTVNDLKEGISDKVSDVKEAVSDKVDTVKEKASGVVDTVKEKATNIGNNILNGVRSIVGSGSGLPAGGGSNSGFVSQLDSKYSNMKLGDSTVGSKGCAPAVAAMAANAYGGNLPMSKAVSIAQKYQNSDGTTLDYFGNALHSSGVSTNYITGNNISGQIVSNLESGNPVILLGKDASNKSKKNSPFGPNNHYVLATGLDKNGNLVIEDPEMKGVTTYPVSILKNASAGIGTAGGGSTYDTDIAKSVWAYFISKGYSPAATAGIMGNLYQESGMDPGKFQTNGPAAGIAQWENYKDKTKRWAALNTFAQSIGEDWSSLDAQLQFIDKELQGLGNTYWGSKKNCYVAGTTATTYDDWKQSTDVEKATRQFEAAFERASKPNMSNRVNAAAEYYKLYQDSNYTYTPSTASTATETYSSGTTEDSSSSTSIFSNISSIVSAISTAFSNGFGKIFGGSDDSTSTASNGGTTSDPVSVTYTGTSPVEYMKNILGKISYSMDGARNPEAGSADCSSTVEWAIKKATGVDIGNNTASQYNNSNLSDVWYDNGNVATSLPSTIKENDVLFFSRPNSDYTAGRKDRVGHVELYEGNGMMIGHGGGMGPKEKQVPLGVGSNGGLIKVARLSSTAGSGSNIIPFPYSSYDDLAKAAGGSSGLLLKKRPGRKLFSSNNNEQFISKSPKSYSGGASDIATATTNMLNTVKTQVTQSGSNGTISASLVEKLINAIVDVLEKITSNTAPINDIYSILATYLSGNAQVQEAVAKTNSESNTQSANSSDVGSSMVNLVGMLEQIARG
jgi:cell wall-associated NlpC family hydrolase